MDSYQFLIIWFWKWGWFGISFFIVFFAHFSLYLLILQRTTWHVSLVSWQRGIQGCHRNFIAVILLAGFHHNFYDFFAWNLYKTFESTGQKPLFIIFRDCSLCKKNLGLHGLSRCAANGEWEVHAFFDKTPTRGSFSTGKDSAFCLYQAWISNDFKWSQMTSDFKRFQMQIISRDFKRFVHAFQCNLRLNRSLTLGRCASNASQSPWCTNPVPCINGALYPTNGHCMGSMMIIHRKWGICSFSHKPISMIFGALLYLGERTLWMKFNVSSKWPMARGTFSISNLLILGTSHPMSFWEDRHD